MPATACLICQIHIFMWTCWTTWTVIIAPLTMTSRKDESYWNFDYLISVIRKTRFEGDDIGWRQMTLYWRRSTGDAKRLLQYEEQDSTAFFRGNNTSRYVVSDQFVCNFLDKAFYTCQFWSQNLNILYSLFLQNSPQLALYWIHGSWNQRIRKFCREFLFSSWRDTGQTRNWELPSAIGCKTNFVNKY